MAEPIGLYLHIPFCVRKCPYCDFYSLPATEEAMEAYTDTLIRRLRREGPRFPAADTLYLGGGTPSLLGASRIHRLVTAARESFGLENAEITLEANPAEHLEDIFRAFHEAGGNRISLGMQAADDDTLRRLGRRHTVRDTAAAVEAAHGAGIDNLSLDILLATEGQTSADVRRAVQTAHALGATHLSAYLLKLEEGTPFGRTPPPLPDEDAAAALYLTACEEAEAAGYAQYEISNWAMPGRASRHNLKYWNSEPYLGLGPSAHSFYGGRRLYFPRQLAAFDDRCPPLPEAPEGDALLPENSEAEYAMLRLRLCEGLRADAFAAHFGHPIPAAWMTAARQIPPHLLQADAAGIRLTREGFLVSDAILTRILLQDP